MTFSSDDAELPLAPRRPALAILLTQKQSTHVIHEWPRDKTGQYDDGVKVSAVPLNLWRKVALEKQCKTKDALLYGNQTVLPTPYRRISVQEKPQITPYRSTN
jgi:hypothetical protein